MAKGTAAVVEALGAVCILVGIGLKSCIHVVEIAAVSGKSETKLADTISRIEPTFARQLRSSRTVSRELEQMPLTRDMGGTIRNDYANEPHFGESLTSRSSAMANVSAENSVAQYAKSKQEIASGAKKALDELAKSGNLAYEAPLEARIPDDIKKQLDEQTIAFVTKTLDDPRVGVPLTTDLARGEIRLSDAQFEELVNRLEALTKEKSKSGAPEVSGSFDFSKGSAEIEIKLGKFKIKGDPVFLVGMAMAYATGRTMSPICAVRAFVPVSLQHLYPDNGTCLAEEEKNKKGGRTTAALTK